MSGTWFQDGLRFTCKRCGRCCTGEPGFVWLTSGDVRRMAERLGLKVGQFRKRNTRKVSGRTSLEERDNGDCVLLDPEGQCTVYDIRPIQCRTWPFWGSNVRTPADWKATCEACPGAGQGRLYTCEQILELIGMLDV